MTEPTPDVTDADLAALLVPLAERMLAQSRVSPQYAALAVHLTVPKLLRAACQQMELPIAHLASVLRSELGTPDSPVQRELVLGLSYLMKTLTDRYRQETHVGCVDRAVQALVAALTRHAVLSSDDWRTISRAVRTADSAIVGIALDVSDLLDARFGVSRSDDPERAAARYLLLLGLPQAAYQGAGPTYDIYAETSISIFQHLAGRL